MKLTDNARHWYRLWSIRLSALGAFFVSVWFACGDQITLWWQTSAFEYFPFLNPLIIKWIGVVLVILGQLARVVKQEQLHGEKD